MSGPPDGSLGRGDGSSAASSPRIGAVLLPRGGGSHGPSQLQVQPPAQHQQGMGAIFRRLSQQMLPVFGGGSGGVPAAAAAADPVAAAPQRAAAAGAAAYVELAVESSGGSSDVRGIFSHKSPAHLLAPAPPPLWAPDTSPPAVELQLVAAERSGGGSMDGTHVQQQQQEHQQHADVLDLLEAGDDLLPHAGARLQAGAADDGALAMQPQVRPLGPQPSGLSSPSSGSYSAAAASGRHLAPEAAADVFAAALGGASWQAQQQEQQQPDASGIVRRSLAGDFTACVPEQQLEQQQLASVAVPRTANGVAQPRAWSEEREHIHLDLDVLESCLPAAAAPAGSPVLLELHSPGAGAAAQAPAAPSSPLSLALLDAIPDAPSAALAGWLEAAQGAEEGEDEAEQQQLLEPLAVGTLPAGYLPSLWARYEQLDNLRRIRSVLS